MSTDGLINVLLVGGGAREHALAWKLRQSPRLGELWITNPENPGLAALGTPVGVPVEWQRPYRIQSFCNKHDIGLAVIGPEEPLALGAADALATETRVVFGPTRDGARLEADKAWCKHICRSAAVPTADGRAFTDPDAAIAYLKSRESPQVVKASGLAKGKGVVVADSLAEALDAVDRMMVRLEFGEAGRTVVIEERLKGREASVLALVDGRNIFVLEPCQDHKRIGDGDSGPNTGGMGAFCPGGIADEQLLRRIEREILVPVVDTLKRDGIEFRGVLYAGIMLTPAGPKVLEFNTRFGDPECQALMARFNADLLEVMLATGQRRLDRCDITWSPAASCCIVLASRGYPGQYPSGFPITGLDDAAKLPGVTLFHSGTRLKPDGSIVTAGGRVLSVTAAADSLPEARDLAYRASALIHFEGKTMRSDIAVSI